MKVIGNKWELYKKLYDENVESGSQVPNEKAFKSMGITRTCCRGRFLSHAELFDKKLKIYQMRQNEIQNKMKIQSITDGVEIMAI